MSPPDHPSNVVVHAISVSDSLGYLGQHAVAQAMGRESQYLIVGGHMVQLLLHVYPTPEAITRTTKDADTALGDIDLVLPLTQNLLAEDFAKERGNLLVKEIAPDQKIEINLLLPRTGSSTGIRPQTVPDVGQVDSLPELTFALNSKPLELSVEAHLQDGALIRYMTRIPDVEAAVVLKAHSWKERRAGKDLADLHSLLEIRQAHPETAWRLNESCLVGFRKDTARITSDLAERITRRSPGFEVPHGLDRLRMAALIGAHIA